MFGQLIAYLRGLARRREISIELEDEMRFHLERQIETNVRRGMSPAEARRMARLDFGGITQTREAVRDVRAIWLDSVWRDIQLAVRLLCARAWPSSLLAWASAPSASSVCNAHSRASSSALA